MRIGAIGGFVFGFLVATAISTIPQGLPPETFSGTLLLASVHCDVSIATDTAHNCQLQPGKTLDDVVQEWRVIWLSSFCKDDQDDDDN